MPVTVTVTVCDMFSGFSPKYTVANSPFSLPSPPDAEIVTGLKPSKSLSTLTSPSNVKLIDSACVVNLKLLPSLPFDRLPRYGSVPSLPHNGTMPSNVQPCVLISSDAS